MTQQDESDLRTKSDRIRLKRAYERPAKRDGTRVLVDRLWPRGVSKADAQLDLWLKDVAPSAELRKWFGHDPERWPEFRRRYTAELKDHRDDIAELQRLAAKGPLTLVYSAHDEQHNDAVVLQDFLLSHLGHS
ncbi:MAG TPA: DUF488 domain-containing protein [Sphingomicrobium sp.]|jgi:uncharacterized protein YeaO (DUF488 family)|nr:DUF488 domain-containing protein [Sphingomicrobium sp.]